MTRKYSSACQKKKDILVIFEEILTYILQDAILAANKRDSFLTNKTQEVPYE
ncbi:hypothetical protein HMPREF3201_01079 [Megasphaera sp. MJR8396C]|nr:hypothetical protein HMPREF3201_01079 [Megasphaera sp. MJR8396C]